MKKILTIIAIVALMSSCKKTSQPTPTSPVTPVTPVPVLIADTLIIQLGNSSSINADIYLNGNLIHNIDGQHIMNTITVYCHKTDSIRFELVNINYNIHQSDMSVWAFRYSSIETVFYHQVSNQRYLQVKEIIN
jgi:hypothetical protein